MKRSPHGIDHHVRALSQRDGAVPRSGTAALLSLGLSAWYADAAVHFYLDGLNGGRVTNRHKGAWYEHPRVRSVLEEEPRTAVGLRAKGQRQQAADPGCDG